MEILKNIMNTALFSKIAYGFFIGFIILIGVLLIGTKVPLFGDYSIKIVQSGSMEPAIKTGALVLIYPTGSYRVGDVVTFGEDTKTRVPTTHRIIAETITKGELMYTTKGDANEEADITPTPASKITGEVIFDIPYIGHIIDFARKPLGFILIIVLPAALVFIDEARTLVREFRKKDEEASE
ncbi:signal peptidase I [Candidatus Parcubacteria bacterium]|uniref:Signal peptidase I n=1 Tax=Candidatus Kaiserbacteria bacterium CG10_big_fil_rev_8_21_14_0_10_47_16 TaxID=1974608 RepID=A0A2H0UDM0_9BACT|nr:signal peptidase I [Candidatus Parcubacteria bacterium]PIR84509.1 MAG: signal peptidase I [Candidatus Kaiserbacteria bacterium CG10_big_fil_rev_8_21_14_0_10_47_16]